MNAKVNPPPSSLNPPIIIEIEKITKVSGSSNEYLIVLTNSVPNLNSYNGGRVYLGLGDFSSGNLVYVDDSKFKLLQLKIPIQIMDDDLITNLPYEPSNKDKEVARDAFMEASIDAQYDMAGGGASFVDNLEFIINLKEDNLGTGPNETIDQIKAYYSNDIAEGANGICPPLIGASCQVFYKNIPSFCQ